MANIKQTDLLKIEKLFEMGGGYVLDFSNSRLQKFVSDVVNFDIYSDKYAIYGDSKAKRIRAFWKIRSDRDVGLLIKELAEYWQTNKELSNSQISKQEQKLYSDVISIANGLLGIQENKKPFETTEEEFLKREFKNIPLSKIGMDSSIQVVLEGRIKEIRKCIDAKASLSAIFMCGSVLEGILLGVASANSSKFIQSKAAPLDKKTGKIRTLNNWTLSNLIDVAHDVKMLGLDVKKFSHSLRDFRNYIHPYQQLQSGFSPDIDTARISWQVLKAAINDLAMK